MLTIAAADLSSQLLKRTWLEAQRPIRSLQTTLTMSRSKSSKMTEEQENKVWDIKTAEADFREKITGSPEKEPPRPFDPPRGVGPAPRDPRTPVAAL